MKSNFPFGIVRSRSKRGVKPVAPPIPLDQPGRLRIAHLLAIFAINKTTYYNRRNAGHLPLPDGNDGRPFYNTSTIRPLVDGDLTHL